MVERQESAAGKGVSDVFKELKKDARVALWQRVFAMDHGLDIDERIPEQLLDMTQADLLAVWCHSLKRKDNQC